MLAARDFLRAPVLRCRAPFWTALSIRETSALCSDATTFGIARLNGGLEAPEVGLHGAPKTQVLLTLAL